MIKADVYWFTGQAGAGKTVLAHKLLSYLSESFPENKYVIVDGDDIRDIFDNKDYSVEGRKKNVDLVQRLCLYLKKNKIVPIVCMVSPFQEQREFFKKLIKVYEVYVYCSEIRGREDFHVEYYEKPETDFVPIDTTGKSIDESFENLIKTP
jgi:adenylylsulfate kinase-like enzyme